MIRPLLAAFFGTAVLFAAAPAHADMCAADQRPGASLLVPYFEVDLAGTPGQGRTTRFWVRNTSTRPKLTNVTLWTNWGIPAFSFNVYLPAYATQRIDLADLFLQGKLPQTGSGVSPIGDFDSLGTALPYANCNNGTTPGQQPVYTDLSAPARAEIQARYSGVVAQGNVCYSRGQNDSVARGYVTVDTVNQCTVNFVATDVGYFFSGGVGAGTNENVLIGGVEYVHPAQNFAQSLPAYPFEAQENVLVPGDASFYSRYSAGIPHDNREPLPFSWSFEFDGEALADNDDADLIAWRAAPPTNPRSCAGNPPWFPMTTTEQVPFDRAGNTPSPDPFPLGETQPQIGLATQRFATEELDVLLLDPLPRAGSGRINFLRFQGGIPDGQAYVAVHHAWQGRFSEMQMGRALDTGCPAALQIPARTGGKIATNPTTLTYIFTDGFSS